MAAAILLATLGGGRLLWLRGRVDDGIETSVNDRVAQELQAPPVRDGNIDVVAPVIVIPSSTATPTHTCTSTHTCAPTHTCTLTKTHTKTSIPTLTSSPTATLTPTPTATHTPSPTATHTPSPTALAACEISVDSSLQGMYTRELLGCPLGRGHAVWCAWQYYENGYMLWRQDTVLVTVMFDQASYFTVHDGWQEGSPINLTAPDGLIAPKRGFGLVWKNIDGVSNRLGWATTDEMGCCAQVQDFERGTILRSLRTDCSNEHNRAKDGDFAPFALRLVDNELWELWR